MKTPPRVVRVAPATVVVFFIMFSPALLVGTALLMHGRQVAEGLLLCAVFGAALHWMYTRRVELAPGRLVYVTMFARKAVDLTTLSRVSLTLHPPPTMSLWPAGAKEPAVSFIVKPFSLRGVAAILQHIQASNPDAELEPDAERMGRGSVESLAHEAAQSRRWMKIALAISAACAGVAAARGVLHL